MDGFCAELSEAHGEPIAGTAAHTRVWLAIEHAAVWAAKAVETADLGGRVRAKLEAWATALAPMRPQLIRRPGQSAAAPTVLVGVCDPGASAVVRIQLPALDALADVDMPALVAEVRSGAAPSVGTLVEHPVVLVCTHGKRDRCCAKRGAPVYERAAAHPGIEAWQTSHLGGHRFAATLVTLPHGVCYGRLQPDDVVPMLEATLRGEIFRLDRYRGRSCYASPGQAAEAFVRERRGIMGTDRVRVDAIEPDGEARWRVRGTADAEVFAVTLRRTVSSTLSPPSCAKPPQPFAGYALLDGL